MEPEFWHDRWQTMNIGFHQSEPETLLQQHWPELGLAAGSTVLVPLCGKSLDMVWLAAQGHKVIGVELSDIAVAGFFESLELEPETRTEPGFTVKSSGPYEIWCGDFFAMPQEAVKNVQAIYDRAALIALPPEMRKRYARKVTELGRHQASTLLITLEYDQTVLPGPPHAVLVDEVAALFAANWNVVQAHRRLTRTLSPKFREHGITIAGETAYIMLPAKPEAA